MNELRDAFFALEARYTGDAGPSMVMIDAINQAEARIKKLEALVLHLWYMQHGSPPAGWKGHKDAD
ncbi:MAG TPA: hypothetical protein VM531_09000 [Sphingomicrobium sp.]|jgi:hypothetical protein|nr:hypothetical protein [Sphingomicrobium sp.]